MSAFSPPHNWCDRVCERCRLSSICAVAAETRDAPPVIGSALQADLEKALRMLEKVAKEQRVSLAVGPRALVLSKRAERLLAAARSIDIRSPSGFLLHGKVARVAHALDDPFDDDLFVFEIVPNLFLIERLMDEQPVSAAAALHTELAPLLARIPPALRAAFQTLIEAGLAPSPYCVDPLC